MHSIHQKNSKEFFLLILQNLVEREEKNNLSEEGKMAPFGSSTGPALGQSTREGT